MPVSNFLKRKLFTPFVNFLKQGVSPEKLALAAALGISLGVFPVIGSTTLLCALAALIFRLNQPAIQLVNYFMYPLQLVLLLPLIRMGEFMFSAPHLPFSVAQIFGLFKQDIFSAIQTLWWSTMYAIVVWCCIAPVVSCCVYFVFLRVFKKISYRKFTR